MTPYSLLSGYQPFGAKHCLRLQGRNGGGGRNLRTVNTVTIFRTPEQNTSYFPLWIPLFVCSFTVGLPILWPFSFSCHSLSCRFVIQGEDSSVLSTRWSRRSTLSAWDDNSWGLPPSAHFYIPLGYINHTKVLIRSVGWQNGYGLVEGDIRMWSTHRTFFLSVRVVNRRTLDKKTNKRN